MTNLDRSNPLWRPRRRDVFLIGLSGFVAAIPLARRPRLTLVRRHVPIMGTIAEFAVAHHDPTLAHVAIDAAIGSLRRVDDTMSFFKPMSDVGRANRQASHGAVVIGDETRHVLREALTWADRADGFFDPALGRATRLWDVTRREDLPPAADVAGLANRRLYRAIEMDNHRGDAVVRFHDADVQLDLGGIAKGHGVDRAVAVLRDHGIAHALVGAGGDLYALGRSPSGEPWRVGIQSPDSAHALTATLPLEDAAIATSGDYRQYFVHQNRRYHHLLDPATGAPRRTLQRSVSVTASTCIAADAGATLAFGMEAVRARHVLARQGARIVHSV